MITNPEVIVLQDLTAHPEWCVRLGEQFPLFPDSYILINQQPRTPFNRFDSGVNLLICPMGRQLSERAPEIRLRMCIGATTQDSWHGAQLNPTTPWYQVTDADYNPHQRTQKLLDPSIFRIEETVASQIEVSSPDLFKLWETDFNPNIMEAAKKLALRSRLRLTFPNGKAYESKPFVSGGVTFRRFYPYQPTEEYPKGRGPLALPLGHPKLNNSPLRQEGLELIVPIIPPEQALVSSNKRSIPNSLKNIQAEFYLYQPNLRIV